MSAMCRLALACEGKPMIARTRHDWLMILRSVAPNWRAP